MKTASVSPDGRQIATSIWDAERGVSDIWIIDTKSGGARRFSTGRYLAAQPVWSPDSARLAYARTPQVANGLGPNLFVRGLGETDPEEVLAKDLFQLPTDWSPNGRFIAFMNSGFVQVENEFQGDIRLVDLAAGRKIVNLVSTPFHEGISAFSPDGRWIAFTSTESGRAELYLQAFRAGGSPKVTGPRYAVSRNGAHCLRWRRDGRELFYLADDGFIYAAPIKLAAEPQIGNSIRLFSISLETRGAVHSLLGFDASRDGSRFLVPIVTNNEKSEIVVMQNWEALVTEDAAENQRPGQFTSARASGP